MYRITICSADPIGLIAGYLEKGSPSYAAVETSAWGDHGKVDREDMLTETLISYLEKRQTERGRE